MEIRTSIETRNTIIGTQRPFHITNCATHDAMGQLPWTTRKPPSRAVSRPYEASTDAEHPVDRASRIERIKLSIARGEYRVSTADLADKFIRLMARRRT